MTADHGPSRPVPAAIAPMSPRYAASATAWAFVSSGPRAPDRPAPSPPRRPRPVDTDRAGLVPVLNRRDLVVLSALAGGRSTAQIATSLAVSRNTARTRIRRVQSKLDVADRAAAVRAAQDLGVLMTMS
jgi:DNA-binding NarL/FixJ family response regulator